jgi:hypothetical protein
VWFAAWEQRARRGCRPRVLPCRFGLGELARLTGLAERQVKASLKRLAAAKLLAWSDTAVEFPVWTASVPLAEREAFREFLGRIANHRRKVPVPRRILRLLAGGVRPALIATILGHVLRCLYLKQGGCSARGRIKASWIAETFGVGLRRVKEARQELVALGWLVPLPAAQWQLNRWGAHVRINLDWSCAGGAELAPPAPQIGTGSAPPESDKNPLRVEKHQKPAAGGPSGVFNFESEELPAQAEEAVQPEEPAQPPAPKLQHVVPEDLRDTARLLLLYGQAVQLGMAAASEWGRLRFMAAAEHALAMGKINACGLFAWLVRGGRWHFATGDDEAAASRRLREHLHGKATAGAAAPVMARPAGWELSDDARLVQALQSMAAQNRLRGDPFPLLKREKPEWSRARWDAAVAEIKAYGRWRADAPALARTAAVRV